ncbi:hypothetical protein CQW23_20487 [Capsicum baccatum]|uniref:FBD domain-containing protein n=1 Tax=Capsicum baccatum TaxID=33114 RepID=A0A2G2W8R7_CAPBA|nr:hypothetical protein CQW23_20487 [Capsicum baccatum]
MLGRKIITRNDFTGLTQHPFPFPKQQKVNLGLGYRASEGDQLLEHLALEKYSGNANHMEINAPKLSSFVFIGNIHFIHLKCVPLLAKVSRESIESSVRAGNYDLAVFFKSIPALKNLHWDYSNFRPDQVKYQESFLLLLTALNVFTYPRDLMMGIEDEIPASFSDVTYNYLRAVKIKGVAGAKVEMQLIKVLLAKSLVLRRMVIDPDIEGDESLKELAQITKFQWASP